MDRLACHRSVLRDELICRVAVNDKPFPYVVPQSFTFTGDAFLIHCSRFGKFSQLIQEDPHIVIVIDRPVALLKAPKGQNTSLEYYSVITRCKAFTRMETQDVIAHQNQALGKFRPENDYTAIEPGPRIKSWPFDVRSRTSARRSAFSQTASIRRRASLKHLIFAIHSSEGRACRASRKERSILIASVARNNRVGQCGDARRRLRCKRAT